MIILLRTKKIKAALMLAVLLFACTVILKGLPRKSVDVFIDDSIKQMIADEIKIIFDIRNEALLKQDTDALETLYNQNVRNGLWAYEHEIKKMKYLHQWSAKQGVEFYEVDSEVILRGVKEKGDGFSLSLLVSTEYTYHYESAPLKANSFRIGTYHSLDILPIEDRWFITKEWYTDPFADSMHLDDIKSQGIKELILGGEPKDLSNIHEGRISAVEYADQYCGAASLPEYGHKYNSNYRNYNPLGGDCANFASQMLFEGGGFRKNRTWNYTRGSGSKAWVNAHAFNNYMLNSGRASAIAHNTYDKVLQASYRLLPGDYIAYEKKGKVVHISVVTGIDSKGYILVNSHNSDRYRVPWDLGWSDKGIKFWLVRVHY